MVYESDFYTTRRPYSRPTISSYTITRLSDDWDSPYSWPVRREFSRILHRPRPHLGIVYTERFLNSRPLTYFDDETKVIRAQAGALLKQINMPALKPSTTRLPYSLDSYSIQRHVPYGVPQHIYSQSYYREPAHLTIGRGHLACVQYAGGKSYPRRKNLYSDENRNIRDEIKFRSYYNRPKHEDPNTLPTGFAWRLLHLPAKDAKPFKLYKHSQTLPQLDTVDSKTDKEISSEKNKTRTIKRYKKHATEPIENEPIFEDENKYVSYKDRPELKDEYLPRKKKTENSTESNKESVSVAPYKIKSTEFQKEPEQKLEEDNSPKSLDTVVLNEDVTVSEKKKKKKREEPVEEILEKPTLSRTKSLLEQKKDLPEPVTPSEDLIPQEVITAPTVKEEPPAQPEEEIKEIVSDIKLPNKPQEEPDEKQIVEETIQEEPKVSEIDYNEVILDKVIEEPMATESQDEPESIIEENKISDLNTESNIEQEVFETEPVNEEKSIDLTRENQETIKEEIKEDIIENETVPENYAALEDTLVDDSVIGDTESDNAIIEEMQGGGDSINQIQEALDDSTIANAVEESDTEQVENEPSTIVDVTETTAKYVNKSDNEGISEIEVHRETFRVDTQVHDGISEVSYTETNTTVYTREETLTQEIDPEDPTDLVTCEEIESSQDNLNNADDTTDEANVDIQEQ